MIARNYAVGQPPNNERTQASPPGCDENQPSPEAILASLRGLRFGSVNIIVQDGVTVQIERTEKPFGSTSSDVVAMRFDFNW